MFNGCISAAVAYGIPWHIVPEKKPLYTRIRIFRTSPTQETQLLKGAYTTRPTRPMQSYKQMRGRMGIRRCKKLFFFMRGITGGRYSNKALI